MADNQRFASSNKAAQNYEQYIVQTVITPHTHAVLDHVPLQKGNRVLDVACGTGIVTRVAAERFDHVGKIVGLDRNPAMLDIARESEPSNISVEWHEGDMCTLLFPDDSFDVVVNLSRQTEKSPIRRLPSRGHTSPIHNF
jgi:ubiquinone/menaquinone biosynthesis C-methylase UbiE